MITRPTPLWSLLLAIAPGAERRLRPVRLAGLLLGFPCAAVIFAPWQAGGLTGWRSLAILGQGHCS